MVRSILATNLVLFIFFLSPFTATAADIAKWKGEWTGTCEFANYNTDNPMAPLSMRLVVEPVNEARVLWTIQYGGEPARNYEMRKHPSGLDGHYILDEKNGILIDRFLIGHELRDLYTINGRAFTNTTKFEGDRILVTSVSYWTGAPRRTQTGPGQNVVNSFAMRDVNRCELFLTR